MPFVEIPSQRASSAATGNVASRSLAFPGNVTAGSLLVVAGSLEPASTLVQPFLSATGAGAPAASGWTVILSWYNQTNNGTFIAYALAGASGACTVTVTYLSAAAAGATAYGTFSITEFTGAGAASGALVARGSSTGPAPGTLAVVNTDLMLGVTSFRASVTPTVPTGWTQIGTQNTFGADITHNFAFKIATATGNEAPAWTLSGSAAWVAQAVRLSLVSGGGGGGATPSSYAFVG
jgi:hypothetical protein